MALINIGGVDQPTPSSFVVGIQDISKASRNANGTMIMERIATKRKLECGWKFLNQTQMAQILNAVSTVFFTVVYFDPQINGSRSATFYVGDRTCGFYDFNGGAPRYENVKFDLIER